MTPGSYDLKVYRGDSYQWTFTLWQDAEMTDPVVLSGEVEAEVRDRPAGTVVVAMACTVTPPNVIDVVLTPANSELLPTAGVWDLQVTFSPTDVRTYVAGKVVVTADVTDSVAAPALARR